MKTSSFENFPWWMVAVSNANTVAIYAVGIFVLSRFGTAWALLYAACCLGMEWRVLAGSCRSCYYYGKRCGFGKGLICSWFFEKIPARACGVKTITWKDVVPDFLISLFPLGIGIVLLIRDFSLPLLFGVISLAFLGTMGTGLVRSRIACKYCKQRELGCPAEQLFSKTKTAA